MTGVLTAADRAEVADVLALYGHAVDAHDWDLLAEVLTDDFELVAGDATLRGLDELKRSVLSTVPLPSHHIDSIAVTAAPDGAARAWSKFVVVGVDATARSGDYLDTLLHRGGRWRLQHRDVRRRYRVPVDPDSSSIRAADASQWSAKAERTAGYRPSPAEDRAAIIEVLHRYGLAVDDRRWDLWDTLFTDDAVIDFSRSTWEGNPLGWGLTDPAGVKAILIECSDPTRLQGQHLMLNSIVDLDGDTARVHSEFLAIGLVATDDPGTGRQVDTGGWYDDELRRGDDGVWRISSRRSLIRWQRANVVPLPETRRIRAAE